MNYKEDKKREKYRCESKRLLLSDASQKIKTTMIGSLDAVEKAFHSYLSDADPVFLEQFREARKRILDLGNDQILKFKEDLENYEVECKSYKPKNLLTRK